MNRGLNFQSLQALGLSREEVIEAFSEFQISQETLDMLASGIAAYNASSAPLKQIEPANMPIAMRRQYQYQFWMTPIWWMQDLLKTDD